MPGYLGIPGLLSQRIFSAKMQNLVFGNLTTQESVGGRSIAEAVAQPRFTALECVGGG